MVIKTTTQSITADDFAAMPDEDRYELVHGILVEREMSPLSSRVGLKIARLFDEFCDTFTDAVVFGDNTGFTLYYDETEVVRKPDVSVVLKSRLPGGKIPSTRFNFSPDVAIEVISPSDTVWDVETKIQEYLDAGTTIVWVVNPLKKNVKVYQKDGSETIYSNGSMINCEPILKGFEVKVSNLFPEL
jgi:Uma2 family endonuclease